MVEGDKHNRGRQSKLWLGYTAVILDQSQICCCQCASCFKYDDWGLTILPDDNITAYSSDHANQNAEKSKANLPQIEAMIG